MPGGTHSIVGLLPGDDRRGRADTSGTHEFATWRRVQGEWRLLFGSIHEGVSIEYHEFVTAEPLRWHESFHPDSFEICLNWEGSGLIRTGEKPITCPPKSVAYYFPQAGQIEAERAAGEKHCFVTIEMSRSFLRELFADRVDQLQPWLRDYVGGGVDALALVEPMAPAVQRIFPAWSKPPVLKHAQSFWYQSRVLEVASLLLFDPGQDGEMFCTRQQRLARERVDKLKVLLEKDLLHPPSMDDLGRAIGCSPAYLSRIFSSEMGMTIPQYLRQVRLERAAALLRAGTHNVTEAAMEVGYSSLSHFSKAFYEMFQCCPGLYPQGAPLFKAKTPGPP
jgi:AraC-like DNA-binding protein